MLGRSYVDLVVTGVLGVEGSLVGGFIGAPVPSTRTPDCSTAGLGGRLGMVAALSLAWLVADGPETANASESCA